jgi:hypothetical protein
MTTNAPARRRAQPARRRRAALAASSALALAAALAAVIACLATPAAAHGYLAVPKSRNKIAHERGEYYVSACLRVLEEDEEEEEAAASRSRAERGESFCPKI